MSLWLIKSGYENISHEFIVGSSKQSCEINSFNMNEKLFEKVWEQHMLIAECIKLYATNEGSI